MRHICLVTLGIGACLGAPLASASDIGLPTSAFTQSWTALPTGHFSQESPIGSFEQLEPRMAALSDDKARFLLVDAFASARDETERRDIAFYEMMSPWDQATRSAFQRLRDAELAYAGRVDARHERFVATLTRVVEGTGRSAAGDGSASAALESAYAGALGRETGEARLATEATQKAWRAYSAAFAAFADTQTLGSSANVTAELQRQRLTDLAPPGR